METIFSTPMRTNNNTRYESGDVRLGNVIDLALFKVMSIEINVETVSAGDSILIQYALLNGGVEFYRNDTLITEVGRHYFDLAGSDINSDTMVNGVAHTNGRARYSLHIAAMEEGEEFPDRPEDIF